MKRFELMNIIDDQAPNDDQAPYDAPYDDQAPIAVVR